ncbi:hypothetical protein JKP88DRAFT_243302 [Tribonema minus]|uniref:Fungal-type protein kinase domain-containing protein n=1 Tax=Tribonema minus TaxID=303371 RepID=A0A836CJM1_9STRA|nr:hypothetical protein JKP88DRAFT_243302 [Tribonema minus]
MTPLHACALTVMDERAGRIADRRRQLDSLLESKRGVLTDAGLWEDVDPDDVRMALIKQGIISQARIDSCTVKEMTDAGIPLMVAKALKGSVAALAEAGAGSGAGGIAAADGAVTVVSALEVSVGDSAIAALSAQLNDVKHEVSAQLSAQLNDVKHEVAEVKREFKRYKGATTTTTTHADIGKALLDTSRVCDFAEVLPDMGELKLSELVQAALPHVADWGSATEEKELQAMFFDACKAMLLVIKSQLTALDTHKSNYYKHPTAKIDVALSLCPQLLAAFMSATPDQLGYNTSSIPTELSIEGGQTVMKFVPIAYIQRSHAQTTSVFQANLSVGRRRFEPVAVKVAPAAHVDREVRIMPIAVMGWKSCVNWLKDISPSNIIVHNNRGFLLDYHVACEVATAARAPTRFTGKLVYSSLSLHEGYGDQQHTVAADLESLFYTFLDLATKEVNSKALLWRKTEQCTMQAVKHNTMTGAGLRCNRKSQTANDVKRYAVYAVHVQDSGVIANRKPQTMYRVVLSCRRCSGLRCNRLDDSNDSFNGSAEMIMCALQLLQHQDDHGIATFSSASVWSQLIERGAAQLSFTRPCDRFSTVQEGEEPDRGHTTTTPTTTRPVRQSETHRRERARFNDFEYDPVVKDVNKLCELTLPTTCYHGDENAQVHELKVVIERVIIDITAGCDPRAAETIAAMRSLALTVAMVAGWPEAFWFVVYKRDKQRHSQMLAVVSVLRGTAQNLRGPGGRLPHRCRKEHHKCDILSSRRDTRRALSKRTCCDGLVCMVAADTSSTSTSADGERLLASAESRCVRLPFCAVEKATCDLRAQGTGPLTCCAGNYCNATTNTCLVTTANPTPSPTAEPNPTPTALPTSAATKPGITAQPTAAVTPAPTTLAIVTPAPTAAVTPAPTPASKPSVITAQPTSTATPAPTAVSSVVDEPTAAPTAAPTMVAQTEAPTAAPTAAGSVSPTAAPTAMA